MHNKILAVTWAVACSSMSMFTLLPAIKTENMNMMYVPKRSPCRNLICAWDDFVVACSNSKMMC